MKNALPELLDELHEAIAEGFNQLFVFADGNFYCPATCLKFSIASCPKTPHPCIGHVLYRIRTPAGNGVAISRVKDEEVQYSIY